MAGAKKRANNSEAITPNRRGSDNKNKKPEEEDNSTDDEVMEEQDSQTNKLLKTTISSLEKFMDTFKAMMDQQNKILDAMLHIVQNSTPISGGQPTPQHPVHLSQIEMDFQLNQKVIGQQQGESEVELRHQKINNAVIMGLNEGNQPTIITGMNRQNEATNPELVMIRSMIQAAGGERADVTSVFRMGQIKDGSSRPLKVICSSGDAKRILLGKEFRDQLNGRGHRPYVRHDTNRVAATSGPLCKRVTG